MPDFPGGHVASVPQEGKCAAHIFRLIIVVGLNLPPAMHGPAEPASENQPALQPNAAIGPALRVIATAILGKARVALTDPEHSDQDAVHDFRRAMKQWRAKQGRSPHRVAMRACGRRLVRRARAWQDDSVRLAPIIRRNMWPAHFPSWGPLAT